MGYAINASPDGLCHRAVPNDEGPLFYVVLLCYFSTGVQYGALQEPHSK
jgi:hypothetical protein